MKFLDNEKLDSLSRLLSVDGTDFRLETRIECYSCKMVNQDKRLFKEMLRSEGPGVSANDLQALSPASISSDWFTPYLSISPNNATSSRRISGGSDQESDGASPVMCDAINCKRLFDLIAALNASFTDYDFSNVKSECFSKVPSFELIIRHVDDRLSVNIASYSYYKTKVWTTLDEAIEFKDCKFYKYNPNYNSADPYSEDGVIWSFNYFFYNPKLKRLLFFTCRAITTQACEESAGRSVVDDEHDDDEWVVMDEM